jgi:serine/threonine protein kinase/tetratricopeptide (TPR) repeat protein
MGNQESAIQCPRCFTFSPEDTNFCQKCGFVLEESKGTLSFDPSEVFPYDDIIQLTPNKIFAGRYRIIEEIGRGGMGRVYKAIDLELDITVALKVIRPRYSSDERFIRRFKKELLTARSLSHENIIRIYDLGEAEGIKYISMEFIKGQNLRDLIKTSGKLTIEKTLDITQQLCGALKSAHSKSIIHRDLKPSNIMVDINGKVHVMDFGLAKSVVLPEETKPGVLVGTPQYFSPEQAKKEDLDETTDIYALGLIIYEQLTGKPAFSADDISGFLHKHIHETPPDPSRLNPQTPAILSKIVKRCLAKDKKDRYPDIDSLCRDLAVAVKTEKKSRIRRIAYWAMPVIVAAGILIGFLLLKNGAPAPPSERVRIAVLDFRNDTGDDSFSPWGRLLNSLLFSDLYQSILLHVLPQDRIVQALQDAGHTRIADISNSALNQIADVEGIDFFVSGYYTKVKEILWLNLLIKNMDTQEIIASKNIECEIRDNEIQSSPADLTDDLTRWIKSNLNLSRISLYRDYDRPIGEILSANPAATQKYFEAQEYFRKKEYEACIPILVEAIDIDHEFAMAYRLLALCYFRTGQREKAQANMMDAMNYLYRASDRHRYFIQAAYFSWVDDAIDKAIEIYRKLLELYPEDAEGHTWLAGIYRSREEWESALDHYNQALKHNPSAEEVVENLVAIYLALGRYRDALTVLEDKGNLVASRAYFHRLKTNIYLNQGMYDLALSEVEKALKIDPDDRRNVLLQGDCYLAMGDTDSAREVYDRMIQSEQSAAQAFGCLHKTELLLLGGELSHVLDTAETGRKIAQKAGLIRIELEMLLRIAYIHMIKERNSEALSCVDRIFTISTQNHMPGLCIAALHYRGLIQSRMGMPQLAVQTAEQLKDLIESHGNQKMRRCHLHLMGHLAFEEKDYARAIELWGDAVSLLPYPVTFLNQHVLYFDALAGAYEQLGNVEKAEEYYRLISEMPVGKLAFGELYAKSFFKLGRIYQNMDWKGKAIEHYEVFQKLWDDADPDLPYAQTAKKQLDLLRFPRP